MGLFAIDALTQLDFQVLGMPPWHQPASPGA